MPGSCERVLWVSASSLFLKSPDSLFSSRAHLRAAVHYDFGGTILQTGYCGYRNTPNLGIAVVRKDAEFSDYVLGMIDRGQSLGSVGDLVKNFFVGQRDWDRWVYIVESVCCGCHIARVLLVGCHVLCVCGC